jgi:hypothetical protein
MIHAEGTNTKYAEGLETLWKSFPVTTAHLHCFIPASKYKLKKHGSFENDILWKQIKILLN